jgi:gamma-glutamyl phosphate reductase
MNAEGKTREEVTEQVALFLALENALDAQIEAVLNRNRQDLERVTEELERLVDRYQVALLNQQIHTNGNGVHSEIREATHRVRQKIRRAQRLVEASLQFFEEQIAQFARFGLEGEYTQSGRSSVKNATPTLIEVRT